MSGDDQPPIDRPVLEILRDRLMATPQVASATVSDDPRLVLAVHLTDRYYPDAVEEATLTVRWYTNDDFSIHYHEAWSDDVWECRWDRHPNPHDARDHFHPPPTAATPAERADFPDDYRDVLTLVLDRIEDRVGDLWE